MPVCRRHIACLQNTCVFKPDLARAVSCPIAPLQKRSNCKAMQNLSWTYMQEIFARLDQPIWHIILKYLLERPKHRDNEIARCNRACNIVWRRMRGRMMRRLLVEVILLHQRNKNRAEWNKTRAKSLGLFCDISTLAMHRPRANHLGQQGDP